MADQMTNWPTVIKNMMLEDHEVESNNNIFLKFDVQNEGQELI